ncbi:ABC transporter, ATP-binding protein [Lachnospiraceae bacterium KM106-2]|nr:ABC transporter, ATP-binding protein [Lachnospiraceae bacterium KM106-2]
MMETTIQIHNLTKKYKSTCALNQINLEIHQGMFGLIGPNGAGKSTLMKILATIQNKTEGEVTICGLPLEKRSEVRSMIGYLPQEFSMYGNMTVYEALDYLAVLSGLDRSTRKRQIPKTLELVNLAQQAEVKVKSLSGGMKRRLGIAQAILHDPKVIIVDEPTVGLDPEERVRFRNLLCELAENRIVLLSTHIVADIEATCDQVAVISEGNLIFQGHIQELLQKVDKKVYSVEISTTELSMIKKKYLVTGILTTGAVSRVKIVSDSVPLPNAKQVEPDVEDAYLYFMHQKNGEV